MTRRLVAVTVALVAAATGCASSGSTGHDSGAVHGAGSSTSSASRTATTAVAPVHVSSVLTLGVGVSRAAVVASGSRLLVLAGLGPGDSSTSRIVSVDVGQRRSQVLGAFPLAVHDACGAFLGSSAYVFGGGSATTVATVQQWDGTRARRAGALPAPRSDSACAQVGSTAYVVGGFDGSGLVRDVVATTDGRHFRVAARLAQGVRYPAVAAVGRYVVVVGGALATTESTSQGPQTAAIQRIDTVTGKVAVIGHLSRPLAHATAVTVAGHLLVAGGRHGAVATRAIEQVDVATGRVTQVGALPRAMSDAGAATVGGVGYLVGGETSGPLAPVRSVLALRVA